MNEWVRSKVRRVCGLEPETMVAIVKKRKYKYFGHVVRGGWMARAVMEGEVEGRRGRGRPMENWSGEMANTKNRRQGIVEEQKMQGIAQRPRDNFLVPQSIACYDSCLGENTGDGLHEARFPADRNKRDYTICGANDARQRGLDALEKTEESKAKKVDPVKLKTFVEKTRSNQHNSRPKNLYMEERAVIRDLCFAEQLGQKEKIDAVSHEWTKYLSSIFIPECAPSSRFCNAKGNKSDYGTMLKTTMALQWNEPEELTSVGYEDKLLY
ncbi:hypothetical protein GQR58_006595 [Nymphon striatum]|nr:hypothetical protein GQR58_006595 [Nymphon striatum]